ncbi:hypothetical protein VKT23_012348 [Stygiomarasmius scandens]|uniref:CxC2-like cysteine cluster KDZ transposase-associated domain-containing protein n=1 Tax=Marasmiellus scandens TaxID=2682957 RepID=A0ABR1J6A4_9AGAR
MSRRKKLLANREAMMSVRTGPDEVSTITTIAAGGSTNVVVVSNTATAQQVTTSLSPDGDSSEAATAQPETMSFDITGPQEGKQEDEVEKKNKKRKRRKRSKKKRRRCEIEQEYQERFPEILDLLIERSYDKRVGGPCACGRSGMKSYLLCRECLMSSPECHKCFLEHHARNLFFHWAYEWDPKNGFFVKKDISTLGGVLDFCRNKDLGCSRDLDNNPVQLIVAEPNGVHSTLVRYCHCASAPKRWDQLFQADMFPATLESPGTAFSFECLRRFDIHTKTSRKTAYDYCLYLQRITDNMFPGNISDVYDNFLIISRVWQTLMVEKWLGQGHGIDEELPDRPKGNVIPYCPVCCEREVNMEDGWEDTPDELKHLHQSRKTIDGNFQANRYSKNADPDDKSFFNGRSFFPSKEDVDEYERTVPQLQSFKHKADCGWIKAIAKQNSKKFRGMDITGIINRQCDHVFVESSTNMKAGERYATTDLCQAKAEGLRRIKAGQKPHDKVTSYDAMCAYCVHFKKRFQKYFPNLYEDIKFTRVCIPLVHVQNHADICMYMYASVYKPCVGRFIGETAEMLWPELNQIGGATRQMTPGRREDTIIFHMTYWNFRKQNNTATTLYNDLVAAIQLYRDHRDHFLGVCEALGPEKVNEYNKLNRSPQIDPKNKKFFKSVYAYDQSKAPSRDQLLDTLKHSTETKQCGPTELSVGEIATFLMEGIIIQEEQRPLRRKIASVKSRRSPDRATDKSEREKLEKERKKLEDRITTWREAQATFMPSCWEHVAKSQASNPENEKLLLPSDFGVEDRVRLGLISVAEEEARLREAHATDLIARLQYICQIISALNDRQVIHTRGQDQHTKSSKLLKTQQDLRTVRLADYNRNRKALGHLGRLDEEYFPFLTVQDTYRKSSELKRRIGDSRAIDGKLWTAGARPRTAEQAGPSTTRMALDRGEDILPGIENLSVGLRALGSKHAPAVSPRKLKQSKGKEKALEELAAENEEPVDEVEDGKLWRVRPKAGFSQEEMDAFMEENRRVQFFRDEAQMERWMEQVEIKHAEFHRAIKYFEKFSQIWTSLAHKSDTRNKPGHAAYARKQAGMYANLRSECETLLRAAATIDETLRDIPEGKTLSDQVLAFRERERAQFWMISSERPPFVDPTDNEPPIDEELGYDTDEDKAGEANEGDESEIESDIGSDEEDDLESENEVGNEIGVVSKRGRDEDELSGHRQSKRKIVNGSVHEEPTIEEASAMEGRTTTGDDVSLQVEPSSRGRGGGRGRGRGRGARGGRGRGARGGRGRGIIRRSS